MKSKKEAIKEIATQNPEGFTVELTTLNRVTQGISVAYFETQNSFDDQGLERVIKHAESHDKVIGGWREGKDYYYDSVKIFENRDEAIDFGRKNQQIAIFDLTNLELIKL